MKTTDSKTQLILASGSPRRSELLNQIGVNYQIIVSEIDESVLAGEAPGDYVCRMALEKALAVRQREKATGFVLGADTAVIVDDRILGKPLDRTHAIEMLMDLSARTHEVWSAVALILATGHTLSGLSISRVTFAPLQLDWIEAYCDSGDPMDKAGAYAVQGMAAQKISRLEGSYSGVMGLPLFETSEILQEAGLLNGFQSDECSR
jgi:septum formation protein